MINKELLQKLSNNKFFYNVSENKIMLLPEYFFKIKIYEPNQLIFKQNSLADKLYLILDGTVKVTKNLDDGQDFNIIYIEANNFFGEIGLIGNKVRSANVYSKTKVSVIIIEKDDFIKIQQVIPETKLNMFDSVATSLKKSDIRSKSDHEKYQLLLEFNNIINSQKKELEFLNQELEEANYSKDQFLSIIAHDLKNPLNTMLQSIELLENKVSEMDLKTSKNIIQKLHDSTFQLSDLMSNLEEWADIKAKRIFYNPSKNDIQEILAQTKIHFIYNINEKHLQIHSNIDKENKFVYADKKMLTMTFQNILRNAIECANYDDNIYVKSSKKNEFLEINIIAPCGKTCKSDLEHMFDIENYEEYQKNLKTNSGFSMILTKEFVNQNGGWIRVLHNKKNEITFSFSVPIFSF